MASMRAAADILRIHVIWDSSSEEGARLGELISRHFDAIGMERCVLVGAYALGKAQRVIALIAVLRFIWTFNAFDEIYLLTGGGAELGWNDMYVVKARKGLYRGFKAMHRLIVLSGTYRRTSR